MTIRKFAPKTQHDYVQRVKDFATFLGRSPDTAKSEDVRGFRLHLASGGAGTPKINATVSALRFFFNVTLDRPDLAKHLSFMHEPRKVPVVLSAEEIARFLEAAPGIKYKAALSVAYGAGLRVSEVVSLKVSDVDSKRMMLRVEQGKGRKDRHAMLSPVPGGGFSLDGSKWVACRPSFFLPVRVLSRLFRRLFLERLDAAHRAGQLQFFGKHVALTNAQAFAAYLAPLRNSEWVVYSKRPFGGPEEVLRYLARYTHRVAISNRRLVTLDDKGVTFKWKDYRVDGPERYKLMTLDTHEFIRRFLMHVLPQGFHRIRYYGLLASAVRADNIARAREMLAVPLLPIDAIRAATTKPDEPKSPEHPCPCCGARMIIIETFERGSSPKYRPRPTPVIRIDTS
jgi:hypothetical protein